MENQETGLSKSLALWKRAKERIPGGSQLLSKRSEMFLPDQWPSFYQKAKGVEVWDLDGKKYIDMSLMGVGSCILGYADEDVNRAVSSAVEQGSMCTLNAPEEVELADVLCGLHPWASMVRYARTGGESMAIAIRIARAYSGKDKIAFCGYHGWSDWYLATNIGGERMTGHMLTGLEPKGVPAGLENTMFPFMYNKIEELEKIVAEHPDLGVIVMEPFKHKEPEAGFLEKVRAIADKIGAVLVFDEISIGWRLTLGGSHLHYGVTPDIAVFAKAMSNGYPMAAIMGKRDVMQAAQGTFISSTYWTERIGPTAALACIKKMKATDTAAHLKKIGRLVWDGWKELSVKHGIKLNILGPESMVTCSFDYGDKNLPIKTLFTQLMLERGYLEACVVYVSLAHQEQHVKDYLAAVDEAYGILAKAISENNVENLLKGPVAHGGFLRLN
ncbi:aminotransferase class III-fold pyridoxal phosphate-dependent enzyme [Candidatus Uhrbacteria bacterium]|nr:aminotransferase class III-fold pyridoxal phosphate-dependent enzyme [Candidatus Uhrbacteria bacterium]